MNVNKKTQEMRKISKKICYTCESVYHEIKYRDSGKNIFVTDWASRQTSKEEMKYRLQEYGKINCIQIR